MSFGLINMVFLVVCFLMVIMFITSCRKKNCTLGLCYGLCLVVLSSVFTYKMGYALAHVRITYEREFIVDIVDLTTEHLQNEKTAALADGFTRFSAEDSSDLMLRLAKLRVFLIDYEPEGVIKSRESLIESGAVVVSGEEPARDPD